MSTFNIEPDSGTGGTTVDGVLIENTNASFTTLRDSTTADVVQTSAANPVICALNATTTSTVYASMYRAVMTVDTSVIGGETITEASFNMRTTIKADGFSEAGSIEVCAASPADDNDLVAADYAKANFGAVSFSSKLVSAISTSVFNKWEFNAAGISHINTSGITGFGLRTGYDLNDAEPTWGSGIECFVFGRMADSSSDRLFLEVITESGAVYQAQMIMVS